MDGQTLRDRFDLRLQVSANDDSLGDRGSRYVGVKSCKPMIEEAAAALDRERALRKEADEALELAWQELNRATEELDRERARLDEVRGEVRLLAYPYGLGRFGPATIEPDFTDLCRIVGLKAEDF